MRIIAIWDIHWKDIWKEIVEKEKDADKIIFIWDYFDSFNINVEKQIENFKEIVDYYYDNKNKVILLMWNHDYHYWTNSKEMCSWFNMIVKLNVHDLMRWLIEQWHIKLLYQYDWIIFSHAWLSYTWLNNNLWWIDSIDKMEIINPTILDSIIKLWYNDIDWSWYWDSKHQWPLWIRPSSLIWDMLPWFKQVVGHTSVNDIEIKWDLIMIDCLDYNNHYLIYNDWEFSIGAI